MKRSLKIDEDEDFVIWASLNGSTMILYDVAFMKGLVSEGATVERVMPPESRGSTQKAL